MTVDHARLYDAASTFLDTYREAVGADRLRLDRQVLSVTLADAEGAGPTVTLDLVLRDLPTPSPG